MLNPGFNQDAARVRHEAVPSALLMRRTPLTHRRWTAAWMKGLLHSCHLCQTGRV